MLDNFSRSTKIWGLVAMLSLYSSSQTQIYMSTNKKLNANLSLEYDVLVSEDNERIFQEQIFPKPIARTVEESEILINQARELTTEKAREMIDTYNLLLNPGKYFAAKRYVESNASKQENYTE